MRLVSVSFRWSLVQDLLPRKKGQALQKAHELVCWWRVGDRVARCCELAATLYASYADGTDEPSAAELRFLRSEGFMLSSKSFEPSESTQAVPGLAENEVVSSWSKNLHLAMPAAVRTRNERQIVVQPLTAAELRQRDQLATFHAGRDQVEPVKATV